MSNTFLDKDGNPVGPFDFNTTLGRKSAALVRSFALSTEDLAAINAIASALAGTINVTGTFFQSTQPVSIASLPSLASGSAVIGKVGIDQTSPGTSNAFSLSYVGGTAIATGNGTAGAGTIRVAIASDNSSFQVNANQNGTWNVNNINGTVSLPTGAATSALQTALNNVFGTTSDVAWASGAGTAISLLKTIAAGTLSNTPSPVVGPGNWEYIPASTTAGQVMGSTGAVGDYLSHVTITPTSTSPGAVQIKDGSGAAVTIFAGGASSVSSLIPFGVPLGLTSQSGAWTIITNANETAIAVGKFS
jgi:hypothetical protein